MIEFHPKDPFPLLTPGQASYAEAQEHSEKVDRWLGLDTEGTEARIAERHPGSADVSRSRGLWIGLPVRALLTPYTEIRSMLHALAPRPGELIVDLGAAYGRMAFVMAKHCPDARFIGYELVRERADEGRRAIEEFGCPNAELIELDLSRHAPGAADFYLLYDFGGAEAIEKTLQDLRAVAQDRAVTVIGRGRGSRDRIERAHPWLSQVVAPEHHGNFSIYRSARA